ncbi:MAG: 4-alpha-glucanotransferase [Clostridiales Family XIII bacterium]|jgi:4-alpha-glucanotransferase|nr:4-alpha-glucanotransferase [Clostridiales Family XIII bacterium]
MNKITLHHDSHKPEYRSPFGAVPCGTAVRLALDVSGLSTDCQVSLRVWFQDSGETLIPMVLESEPREAPETEDATAFAETNSVRRYAAEYKTPGCVGLAWYYFIVQSVGITRYYGNNPQNRGGVGAEAFSPPPSYQVTVYEPTEVPAWWKEGLVYQIYVDRFARGQDWKERFFDSIGDEGREGPTRVLQAEWRDAPFLYKDDRGWVMRWPFFGGTLEGVREKLPYLRSLGVTSIYLNPIFEAASSHKYDTGDYMKIDPGYGDEAGFRALAEAAEAAGMSLVLDGVFSHTGADSVYFNKYGNYDSQGAWQSKDSPYRKWYRFDYSAVGYECWWGVADLPNVDETDPDYQEFIVSGEDSVIRHWLRAGARGWRLDVADELPDSFIKNLRAALKETKPDGLLLGEVWEDASNKRSYGVMREYLLGRELDATMHYPFRDFSIDFALNRISPAEVHSRVMSIYENYPRENFYACMNLISSHDRMRVLSVLGEAPDERSLSDWQKQSFRLDCGQRDLARRRMKLLSLWQMAFPGAPHIFYGDEAGVEGYSDPYNRAPFPWGKEDEDLSNWYRIVTGLRAEYDVLRKGGFTSLGGYQHIYAFVRDNPLERVLVFLNPSRSCGEDVEIPVLEGENVFLELLSGGVLAPERREGGETLRLSVGPLECRAVYARKAPSGSLTMKDRPRAAGVLLHVTSLPSDTGCGDFGAAAREFCDWLASAGQKIWQILPLTPAGAGHSPYSGCSAFGGNELLLDCAAFVGDGLIGEKDLPKQNLTAQALRNIIPGGKCLSDFERAATAKRPAYERAFAAFDLSDPEFRAFCEENACWLGDYALHRALTAHFGGTAWQDWPEDIRDRKPEALADYSRRLADSINFHRFLQYQFDRQWRGLRAYARSKGISVLGDMPLYVAADSCDAWARRELFALDGRGRPLKTGGCPPDAFTEDGQNWKTPVFDWKACKADGWRWWIDRFRRNLKLYDFLRLDHFRGFDACWEIPGDDLTAKGGVWIKGPGKELFEAAAAELGPLPFLAEDLGVITSNVEDLKNTFMWPGMRVYQFHADRMALRGRKEFEALAGAKAAGEATAGAGVPEAREAAGSVMQVYYTGTHDNDALMSWAEEALAPSRREKGAEEGGAPLDAEARAAVKAKCVEIIEGLYGSDAMWVILPLQDVWFLGSQARMNTPGVAEGNWAWAAPKEGFTKESAAFLKDLATTFLR